MPVITVEKPEHIKGTLQARLDWAEVTGKELTLKPPVFHHEDGHTYSNIIGGIAYPAAVDHIIRPGMVIIIGIEPDPVKFRVLETVESPSVFDLFTACIDLRLKYGYGEDRRILPNFMGDQEKYLAILLKVSEALEKTQGHERGLYIKDMVDYRERYALPVYVRQLLDARKKYLLERPDQHIELTNHLRSFQPEMAEKGRVEDFPAVGLLGGMIHSLQIERPWLEDPRGHDTVFNID
jgi:hypothetical protein